MKIAFLSFYSGITDRGAENWVYEIASRLRINNTVTVFQNNIRNPSSSYQIVEVRVKFDPNKPYCFDNILSRFFLSYPALKIGIFTLKVLPRLWKERYDVIIPVNGGWQSLLIRIFTIFSGSKMVIVGHSGIGWDDRFNISLAPDAFVALTEHAARWARKVNRFVRIEHIPNGVDLDKFTPQGKKLSLGFPRPIILCAGALVESKQIALTINAVAKLKDASLLVAGKGPLQRELTESGNALLGSRFKLAYFDYEDMPSVFRAADIFTLASWERESFPLVYLQAMSSNIPVVATNDLIRKEIIGDAGILVNPLDSDLYAQALERALCKDWKNIPRLRAENYDWNKVTKCYESLLESLVL